MLPYSGDSVASWSSCMSQSRVHIEIFRGSLAGQCPSREKYLEYFSKFGFLMFHVTQSGDLFAGGRSSREKAQRFSRLTLRLLCGQNSQSRKNTQKNFSNFCFECSGDQPWQPDSVTKLTCFAHISQFLNVFSFSLEHF